MTTVPFRELISHTFSLDHTKDALLKSMEPDSLKVVVKP